MEIATIQGEKRTPGSRHANERTRGRGLLPAVIYGHNEPPETVALSLHDTRIALEHMAHVINLRIGNEERQYLVKDVQYDHLQELPIHVDLMRVDPNERVQVRVPVLLRGTPAGAAEGGTLVQILSELEVECLLLKIPNELRVRVDHLALNASLHVKEIELPPDVKALHKPDDIVAVVHPPRGLTAEETAEAAATEAEPEVIGKGPKEEAPGAGGE
jgi:large subunit ribosomal protein L25